MFLGAWMIQNTLAAACLALVVAAACRFGRFGPAVRHALWLVVLIKLVTPPVVEIPLPFAFASWVGLGGLAPPESGDETEFASSSPHAAFATLDHDALPGELLQHPLAAYVPADAALPAADSAAIGLADTARPPFVPSRNSRDEERGPALDTAVESTTPWRGGVAGASRWWRRAAFPTWLEWGWWAGTGLVMLVQARRLVRLRRLIAGGHPAAPDLSELVARVAGELGVRPPPVRIVPGLPSPSLCAFGAVALLWPQGALDEMAPSGRRAVVFHELIHLRRRDHWVGWLELVAGCGWWWNPLYWHVRRQLHEDAELACDAWVVALLPDGRRAYAEALIDVAQGDTSAPLPGVVLGAGDGSRKLLERRLIMIMRGKVRYQVPAIGLAVIALVALATIPRWSIGQEAPVTLLPASQSPYPTTAPVVYQYPSDPQAVPGATTLGQVPAADPLPRPSLGVIGQPPVQFGDVFAPVAGNQIPAIEPDAPATTPLPVIAAQPTTVAATAGEETRLERLEAQLAALLAEVKSLRTVRPATAAARTQSQPVNANQLVTTKPSTAPANKAQSRISTSAQPATPQLAPAPVHEFDPLAQRSTLREIDADVETVAITRATYKLPAGRAETLARFLHEQLNDDIEVKVKGDALQITASSDDQQAIARLIGLLLKKGREPARAGESDRFEPIRR